MVVGMYFDVIHCEEGTTEIGADEPYVLITTIDLAHTVKVQGFPIPLPAFEVFLHGPFEDFKKGSTQSVHSSVDLLPSFWDVAGKPSPLPDPDKAIFIVSLMENDDGHPESLRTIVKGVVGSSVFGSLGFDRATLVAKILQDVNGALDTPTGAPNFDDKIGSPQELRFSSEELRQAASGQLVTKSLTFEGDGGRYALTFVARTFETRVKRFLLNKGFDLGHGFGIRSMRPPVTSLRALIEV
jgi:hypothetical protein